MTSAPPVSALPAAASKWSAPSGYNPITRSAPAPAPAPATPAYSPPATSALAATSKWSAPSGYNPSSRPAAAPTAPAIPTYSTPATSAPAPAQAASKWSAPSGYNPSSRPAAAVPAPATPAYSPPIAAVAAPSYPPLATPAHAPSREAAIGESNTSEEAAVVKTDAEAEHRMLTAVYSPAIEKERLEREAFYLELGVPLADAKRLVARILAAYA